MAHGADVVVHSATKSLTCSGFGVVGLLVSKNDIVSKVSPKEVTANYAQYVKFLPYRDMGPCLSPMQCILTLNDMRTIRSKMDMFSQNALKVAQFLNSHKRVSKVEFLGLPNHELHELASKYMELVDAPGEKRFGHLMSFVIDGSPQDTRDFFDALQQIYRATDLGRVKSVATHPSDLDPSTAR